MSTRPGRVLPVLLALPLVHACATHTPGTETSDVTTFTPVVEAHAADPSRASLPAGARPWIPVARFPADTPLHVALGENPAAGEAFDDDPDADLWARLRDRFRLDDDDHGRIEAELQRFDGRQRYFDRLAENAEPYLYAIVEQIEARGLPGELVAQAAVESGFRPFGYSHGRAAGIWQFVPGTARHYGLEQNWWYDGRRDILASTRAALDYMEYLHDFFDGDWLLAMAAYNAGEGRVRRAVRYNERRGRPTDFWHLDLPAETRAYVPRILALSRVLAEPGEYHVELPRVPDQPALARVDVEGQIDLARAAQLAELPVSAIYRYNPALNRWATPPEGPHHLLLPVERAEPFRAALSELDPAQRVRWQRYRVRPGDTPGEIAQRFGTTVEALLRINNRRSGIIRAGEHLLVATAASPEHVYTLSQHNRLRAAQSRGAAGRTRIDYRVRPGDSLWGIAQQHDVSVRRLAKWNGMAPGDVLQPGRTLAIWVEGDAPGNHARPANRIQRVHYTVRPGDSLYAIGRRFNVDLADIARWNGIDTDHYLQPGQQLRLRVDVTEQADAS